jgi:hypothetical protein
MIPSRFSGVMGKPGTEVPGKITAENSEFLQGRNPRASARALSRAAIHSPSDEPAPKRFQITL